MWVKYMFKVSVQSQTKLHPHHKVCQENVNSGADRRKLFLADAIKSKNFPFTFAIASFARSGSSNLSRSQFTVQFDSGSFGSESGHIT